MSFGLTGCVSNPGETKRASRIAAAESRQVNREAAFAARAVNAFQVLINLTGTLNMYPRA
jgi:hypothetical protein